MNSIVRHGIARFVANVPISIVIFVSYCYVLGSTLHSSLMWALISQAISLLPVLTLWLHTRAGKPNPYESDQPKMGLKPRLMGSLICMKQRAKSSIIVGGLFGGGYGYFIQKESITRSLEFAGVTIVITLLVYGVNWFLEHPFVAAPSDLMEDDAADEPNSPSTPIDSEVEDQRPSLPRDHT